MAAEPRSKADLIPALSEDLALEILASYTPEDFADADFTSLGRLRSIWPSMNEDRTRPSVPDRQEPVRHIHGAYQALAIRLILSRLFGEFSHREVRTRQRPS